MHNCSVSLFVVQLPGIINATSTDVLVEDLHEEEPHNMKIGISIQNLLKIYDDVSNTWLILLCGYMHT